VVGRYLLKHLASPASCFQLCYSCSRRAADVDDVSLSAKLRSVQVDLLKADGAEERSSALAPLGVTHMFFADTLDRLKWAESGAAGERVERG